MLPISVKIFPFEIFNLFDFSIAGQRIFKYFYCPKTFVLQMSSGHLSFTCIHIQRVAACVCVRVCARVLCMCVLVTLVLVWNHSSFPDNIVVNNVTHKDSSRRLLWR